MTTLEPISAVNWAIEVPEYLERKPTQTQGQHGNATEKDPRSGIKAGTSTL